MKLKNLGLLLLAAWAASSCGEEPRAPVAEPAPAAVRTTRQEARSTNKVLILDSSVNGGLGSREALAVKSFAPTAQITVATPAAWRAMTAEEFMLYRTIIIGDAACESGTAAFQAAVDTRRTWGAIIDGDVALLSTDPTHNNTGDLVENAIKFVLRSAQYRTGMYIALGCAYQDAPADTAVPLLEPFGDFKVEGVPGCADSGHMFEMSPPALSSGIFDGVLVGNGCAARSVFTSYPEHTFAHAAIATSSSGAVIPGQQTYIDYLVEPGQETPFVGAPYLLVKGAMALGAGCGDLDNNPPEEECDAGDGTNGQPAPPGQDPLQTCSFSCHLNWCGDGVVDAAFGEECDNGVNNGRTGDAAGNLGACSGFCRIPNIPPPNRPPMAVCRDVTVAATNTCGVPADINNGSSDPDGDPVSCVQNPPGPYGIGTTTVTLACSDPQGQFGTCTGTVTVTDQVAPTVTLEGPANEALECTRGDTYPDQGATANDVCEGPLPVTSSGSVNMGTPGSYALTYSATDAAGNVGTATRTVLVSDTLPPTLTLAGANPLVHECSVPFNDPGSSATDQCAGILPVTRTGSVDILAPGPNTLTYSVNDGSGHTASQDRAVNVGDTLPPAVTINGPLTLQLECRGGPYTELGATASDACAGPLTAVPTDTADPNVVGTYTIGYRAVDPSGNVGTSSNSRVVTVSDTLAPVLTLEGANPQTLECGTAWVSPGATANDQCVGSRTAAITVSGTVNDRVLDTYTVTYSVSDGNGNTQTQDRTVNVNDTLPPAITVQGPLNDTAECGSNYVDPSARANDVCAGLVPVTATRTGNTSRPGTLTISYTATDPSGNSVTSADTRTVTVSDTQLPTLELVGAATQRLECGSAYNEQGVRANDLCFGDLSSSVTTTGSVSPGTPADYTLVYDVTDGAGNRAPSVSRTMEVRDTLAPTLAVRAPFSQQVQCDHVPYEDPGATATDVCAGDLTGAIQRTGSVNTGTPGDYTLTYRVVDPSGNETTATEVRKIKVVDDMPPTLQLVGPAKAEHECGTAYDDPGARASDVCAGDLTGNITRTGTVNPAVLGPYEILYTVADPSNHTATTRREVSVRDTQPPSITCPEPIVVETLEGTLATVALGAATATDSCAMGEISGPTEKSFPVGTTDVKYTATDAAGNQASCTSTITVMAITLPGSPLDRALLGGGSGCSSTSSGPSALAMMGLAVLAALLARRR